jgi:prepilin peptidase CpaA
MTATLIVTAFPLLMILAGAGDVIALRIPNWIVAALLLLFIPAAYVAGLGWNGVLPHLAVFAVLLVAGFLLFAANIFGAGDAKLLAAAGLWFGWPASAPFLTWTIIAGGVLAIAVALWSLVQINSEITGGRAARLWGSLKPNVPYGYAIAAGAILALPQSVWMGLLS